MEQLPITAEETPTCEAARRSVGTPSQDMLADNLKRRDFQPTLELPVETAASICWSQEAGLMETVHLHGAGAADISGEPRRRGHERIAAEAGRSRAAASVKNVPQLE